LRFSVLPCLKCATEMTEVLGGWRCPDCGFFLSFEALDSIFAPVNELSETFLRLEEILIGKKVDGARAHKRCGGDVFEPKEI